MSANVYVIFKNGEPVGTVIGDDMKVTCGLASPVDIRTDAPETSLRLAERMGAEASPATGVPGGASILGIPVVVDPDMPPDTVKIGERYFHFAGVGLLYSFEPGHLVENLGRPTTEPGPDQ